MARKASFGSLIRYIPPQLRLSGSDVTAAAMWGGTAVIGAIWLVQPFGYIRSMIGSKGSAEQEEGDQVQETA